VVTESTQAGPDPLPRLGYAVLALFCAAAWALSHSYRGIFHDAGLYTLQALAHLDPASLGQDVFLRFGSQDRFTIFGALYAGAMHLGPEPAAALLTFALQLGLFAGAWVLARTVMGPAWALLALAAFIAVPGDYGADRVFTFVEPFLTPRMAAEAMVLGSLAAALSARRLLAWILIILAALLHPIMAAAGVVALLSLYVAIPRPRAALAVAACTTAVLMIFPYAVPLGGWGRFDGTWLNLVMTRSPYLFLAHWQMDDWGRVGIELTTLAIGVGGLPSGRARTLCQAVLLTAAAGLALTFLACDLGRLVVFTQMQPWRWMWLGAAASALMLPVILRNRWQAGTDGRTTALLLIAAWIFAQGLLALAAALAALAALALLRRLRPGEARWVFWGACGMLLIAIAWRVASNLEFTDAHYLDTHIPLWLRRTMSFAHDGSAPLLVIALAWWLACRTGRIGLSMLAAIGVVGCALLLPQTWSSWTAREYPPRLVEQFAPWRERIPSGAQVFWPESPVSVWLLLDRPSYLSVIQTSGMVFSRDAALEMQRRALALRSAIPPGSFLAWDAGLSMHLTSEQVGQACRTGEFQFLVTGADLGTAPVAVLSRSMGAASKPLRLYRCSA
jgi:hypothetical protein